MPPNTTTRPWVVVVAVAVDITGNLHPNPEEYLNKQGLRYEEVTAPIKARAKRYRIIDGQNSHVALLEWIMETTEKYYGFEWKITIIKGGKSVQSFRKMSRIQNIRHSDKLYVEMTINDTLYGLRSLYGRLTRDSNGKISAASEVYLQLDGINNGKDRKLKQTAATVASLTTGVVQMSAENVNGEHPDICISRTSGNANVRRKE